jgi:Na+/H+ antiporter NhaD/arsenite permease-like protein
MRPLPGIFSLLVAIAGWHYLFYSRAAHRLGGMEDDRSNRQRIRLRRINGSVMLLLAVFFFAGFYTVDDKVSPGAFLLVWLTVFVLMFFLTLLAFLDLLLTARMRRQRRQRRTNPPPQ